MVTPVERKRMEGERRREEKEKLLRNGKREDEETTTTREGTGGGLRKETYTVSSPSLYLRERSSRRTGSPPALFNGTHMREFERPQVSFSLLQDSLNIPYL